MVNIPPNMAQTFGQPAAPNIYPIYLGFYAIPSDNPLPLGLVQVNCYYSSSPDGVSWTSPTLVGSGTGPSSFFVSQVNLDPSTQYQYYYTYQFSDGSQTQMGEPTNAGLAQLIVNPTVNTDNLDALFDSVGLVTSGIFRGVQFETAATPPWVVMNPTGIAAIGPSGPLFQLNAQQGTAFFSGSIETASTPPWVVLNSSGLSAIGAAGPILTLSATNNSITLNGEIYVYGMALPTGPPSGVVPSTSLIQWLTPGSVIIPNPTAPAAGFSFTSWDAGGDFASAYLSGGAQSSTGLSRAVLGAVDDQFTYQAYVYAQQQARGGTTAWVEANAGSHNTKIIDKDGNSSFIQNPAVSALALQVGNGSFTGVSGTSVGIGQGHSLGRTPIFAFVVGEGWSANCTYLNGSSSSTNAQFTLSIAGGGSFVNTNTYNFTFIVIG